MKFKLAKKLKLTIFAARGGIGSRVTDIYTVLVDIPKSITEETFDDFVNEWIKANLCNVCCFNYEKPFEKDEEYVSTKKYKSKKSSSVSEVVNESANREILEKLTDFGELQYRTKSGDFVKVYRDTDSPKDVFIVMPETLMPKNLLSALDDEDFAIVSPARFIKQFPSNIIDFSTEEYIEEDYEED